jgi:hypothetical protein
MRYVQNPRTAARVLEGLAFVVSTDQNKMITLNRTGTLVWELAESGCTVDEVVAALKARYGVPEEQARLDATTFIEDLCRRGVLVERE